ncbi:MAG: hypothetical protein QXZ08_01565 [Nitrososphaeria archaeon]
MPEPTVVSANVSSVKVDGEVIPGLQSIEWKIIRNRQNVYNIGGDERIGVDYGPLYVHGVIRVRSTFPKFDNILLSPLPEVKSFQLVVELKMRGTAIKTISFDDCYLEDKTFTLDANGVGISLYTFTATRVREQ